MFGEDDDMEAKRAMLEKMRDFGSSRMLEGLKKKPDLSITIAAGPAGARPPSKLQESDMGDEPEVIHNAAEEAVEPGMLDEPSADMKAKLDAQRKKDMAKASARYMSTVKDPFAR